MDILRQHEVFEIEVLEKMNSAKMLEPLVFGGGTMLRLCHELNRYSVDLDFWFVKKVSKDAFFETGRKTFEKDYEITDAQMKHYTILFELRSARYPKRLKIEMRKEWKEVDYQQTIAFSRFSTKQVLLKAHTLDQTMKNKMKPFLIVERSGIASTSSSCFAGALRFPSKTKGNTLHFKKSLLVKRHRLQSQTRLNSRRRHSKVLCDTEVPLSPRQTGLNHFIGL